jgi:hypothetical protein
LKCIDTAFSDVASDGLFSARKEFFNSIQYIRVKAKPLIPRALLCTENKCISTANHGAPVPNTVIVQTNSEEGKMSAYPQLGLHYVQALEAANNTNSLTFYGSFSSIGQVSGLFLDTEY